MDEFKHAIDKMKYAVNHSYRFQLWYVAFSSGLMQATALYFTEIVCCFVCAFSEAPVAIVENFIALGIIADFDNYIFESF